MEISLRNRPDLLKRLVYGKPGRVQMGVSVTPEFDDDVHVAGSLQPIPHYQLIMGWDFGMYPSCVICQIAPSGRLFVLDVLVGDNCPVSQLIDFQVIPRLAQRYPWSPRMIWHVPDPAGNTREQSGGATAFQMINAKLPGYRGMTPAIQWPEARENIKSALNMTREDGRWIQMDAVNAKPLIVALRGGWHYKRLPSGLVLRQKPVKDRHSHPADAFAGMLGRILGIDVKKKPKRRRSLKEGRYAGAVA